MKVVTKRFLEFAAGVLGVPAGSLSLETTYGSIPEWDSIAQLRLVTEIASEYGVEIPFADVVNVTSLWEFLRRINGGAVKKVVAVDLDNTLWEGVVGEDGVDGIRPNHALQSELKALKKRGVLLVILSKNNEKDALEGLDKQPILSRDDFVTWRINWELKAENLISIAEELNLGVDSFVFVDDNPVERLRMAAYLPRVAVAEFPPKLAAYFPERPLTKEDRRKTEEYRAEAQRRKFLEQLKTSEEAVENTNVVVASRTVPMPSGRPVAASSKNSSIGPVGAVAAMGGLGLVGAAALGGLGLIGGFAVGAWAISKAAGKKKVNEAVTKSCGRDSLSRQNMDDCHLSLTRQAAASTVVGCLANVADVWLALGIKLDVHPLRDSEVSRVAQLSQKANQFDVCTNRYAESDIHRLRREGLIVTAHARDKFGDQGIVAFVIVRGQEIIDWVMSCRVMDRGIEDSVQAEVESMMRADGAKVLKATWRASGKNECVKNLYERFGFDLIPSQSSEYEKHYCRRLS